MVGFGACGDSGKADTATTVASTTTTVANTTTTTTTTTTADSTTTPTCATSSTALDPSALDHLAARQFSVDLGNLNIALIASQAVNLRRIGGGTQTGRASRVS
jgi:carbohydrate-binding DOMON domain-containing protein